MNRMKTAKGERHEKPATLHHIEVKEAANGGHVVTSHYNSGEMGNYKPPDEHVFGADEGDKAMDHIASTMNMKPSEAEGEETGENTEEA
jgi:hypothetical protein